MDKEDQKRIIQFLDALNHAQDEGATSFPCTICGGDVHLTKASTNGHIHARCHDCGMTIVE